MSGTERDERRWDGGDAAASGVGAAQLLRDAAAPGMDDDPTEFPVSQGPFFLELNEISPGTRAGM